MLSLRATRFLTILGPVVTLPLSCAFLHTASITTKACTRRGSHSNMSEDDFNFSYFDSAEDIERSHSSFISPSNYLALEAFALEQPNENPARKRRMKEEHETRKRFVYGNELLELRTKVKSLQERMSKMRRQGSHTKMSELFMEIKTLLVRDAEYMYGQALALAEQARLEHRQEDAETYSQEAKRIRSCLPHLNIDGLWVGKYGDHGYEMINVTYVGDTLIATKVTGDKNVPKGEISFTADLRPSFHSGSAALAPIQLSQAASKQWGTKGLIRFPGKGQVAGEGYVNSKWMAGQLIMVGEEYFSFAWIPIGYQIFFGRPSPELTLKMIRQSNEVLAEKGRTAQDLRTMRAFASRCLEVTEQLLDDDIDGDHFQ